MDASRTSLPLFLLCLAVTVSAVTNTQTISIYSPTSGAALNPVGAAINTKLQAKIYASRYVYGQYSPYGGIGMGAGLAGYGAVASPRAVDGYGAVQWGYGSVPGYQYGYPGLPGAYTVKTIYPPGKADYSALAGYPYSGVYPNLAGYPYSGVYPNLAGYSYTVAGTYPAVAGLAGSQYGVNRIGYRPAPGYLSYGAVNKLAGYGQ